MSLRVMIVVTHLMGVGHLNRALTLTRAFEAAGHTARLVSGGIPIPHLTHTGMRQLPPVRSNGEDFSVLLTEAGHPATDDVMAARRAQLLAELDNFAPDLLITELFPFGRRILRDEFTALLEAAQSRTSPPRIVTSLRDVPEPPSKPKKLAYAEEMVRRHYDHILVHSDPALTRLEASWPLPADLLQRVVYTGYVASPMEPPDDADGAGEILVSAGGGGLGDHVFDTALAVATGDPRQWRLRIGGPNAATRIARLRAMAPDNARVEPVGPQFHTLLQNAAASVSMFGYNTAMDLLQAGTPAVVIPWSSSGQKEQTLRAQTLRHLPGLEVVPLDTLTTDSLSAALDRALQDPPRARTGIAMDGAAGTVRVCERLLGSDF